jgi:hypothetical protein
MSSLHRKPKWLTELSWLDTQGDYLAALAEDESLTEETRYMLSKGYDVVIHINDGGRWGDLLFAGCVIDDVVDVAKRSSPCVLIPCDWSRDTVIY